MNKKNLSSVEIAALVQELQILVRGKLPQIYHQTEKEFLFQFHVPTKGKLLLKVIPGKFLCLTRKKDVPLTPSSFCLQLRKHLDNAFVKAIYQKDSERIVVFELEKETRYFLIIELFAKGNIILADEQYKIIGALEQQTWKDRTIRVGLPYQFPASAYNWKTIREKELASCLVRSDKKNVAMALATDIGLGGVYAEDLCLRAGVEKDAVLSSVEGKSAKALMNQLEGLRERLQEKPRGCMYAEQITPFPLHEQEPLSSTETYNEAIDTLNPYTIISPYEKKIRTMEKMISSQEESMQSLKEKIETNTEKGQRIYNHYAPLHRLLEIVKELRKTKDWKDVEKELLKEKKIKQVDLKNKRITLDL